MLDLMVIAAGFVVGALLVVAVNGTRRGRPLAAAPTGRRSSAPEPAPQYRPAPAPGPGSHQPDHGIRVNLPGSAAAAPSPDAQAPPRPAVASGGPSLGKAVHARLVIEGAGDVELHDAPVTLGRGNDRTLRVIDSRASRNHALVRRRSKGRDGWEVKDDGSANGTFLNGHQIPDGRVAPLRDGDRIGIGDTDVIYVEGGGSGGTAPDDDPDRTQVQPR